MNPITASPFRLGLSAALLLSLLTACPGGSTTPTGAPVTETANIKSSSIGVNGGKVIATAANGVTYTLTIPPDALTETKTITLTPISSMGSAPLARGVVGAVQMEPSGLQFQRAATLRIGTVPTVAAGKKLIGFNTANDGTKFTFNLPVVKNGATELSIYHFSNSGFGTATPAEIATIPALEPLATLTETEFKAEVDTAALQGSSDADISNILKTWFSEIVEPLLDAAKNTTDFDINNKAEFAFERWFDAREGVKNASVGGTDLTPLLTEQDNFARPIVAKHVLALINDLIGKCQSDNTPDLKMDKLRRANALQLGAKKYGFDTAAFGLDKATFLSKVNNCARIVLDPIKPLTQIVIGSDKSLDARAQVVFPGNPNPQGASFEFKVSSSGATIKQPTGFSSADGRYTTVITPNTKVFGVSVEACLVFPDDTEASGLCAKQGVSSVVTDGIFRGTVTIEYRSTTTGGAPVINGTSSDVTTVSISATVSIDPSKLESQVIPSNKNAVFSLIKKGDVIISSTCQRQIFNTSQTGSSRFLLPQESMFSIRFTDTEYTFSTGNIVGPTTTTGTITEQFVVTDRCPEVALNEPIVRQVNINTARHEYLLERIVGTGSMITNAEDGSKTISGTSTKTETLQPSPGVTQTTDYTMTWNLTAR